MDSLTQIILGAACGEIVLGKKIGNKAYKYLVSCAWRIYAYKIGMLQIMRKIMMKLFSFFLCFKNNIAPNGKNIKKLALKQATQTIADEIEKLLNKWI